MPPDDTHEPQVYAERLNDALRAYRHAVADFERAIPTGDFTAEERALAEARRALHCAAEVVAVRGTGVLDEAAAVVVDLERERARRELRDGDPDVVRGLLGRPSPMEGARLEAGHAPGRPAWFLDGRPVHAGDVLDVWTAENGWIRGVFEWSYRPEDAPRLRVALGDPQAVEAEDMLALMREVEVLHEDHDEALAVHDGSTDADERVAVWRRRVEQARREVVERAGRVFANRRGIGALTAVLEEGATCRWAAREE